MIGYLYFTSGKHEFTTEYNCTENFDNILSYNNIGEQYCL